MTEQEWRTFVLEVEHGFKGEGWSPEAEVVARSFLGDLPYAAAHNALALLVADGMPWTPAPADVMRAAQRCAGQAAEDAPPFEEAWRKIVPIVLHVRLGTAPMSMVLEAIGERVGEGAARWVAARGSDLMLEQTDDPDHGGAVRHRLAQEYDRYCRQAAEDGRRGLALEQARRQALGSGPRPIREVLGPGS